MHALIHFKGTLTLLYSNSCSDKKILKINQQKSVQVLITIQYFGGFVPAILLVGVCRRCIRHGFNEMNLIM